MNKEKRRYIFKDGKELILGSNALTGKEDTLSIVKYLRGYQEDSGVGYLVVNVSKNIFKKAFENRGNYKTNCFMVVDENKENQLIYFQGDENYKEGIYKAYIEDSVQSGNTSYIFSTRGSFVNGWKLISGIQSSELNAQKISIGTLISIMILILFGVGMFVSETDTPEQVKAKCKSFVARFETYIANLNVIINSGDELASEMRKARVKRLYSALDENEKEDIKALLN